MSVSKIHHLNRFTTLPVLLDLLQRKKLTLLNPELWEDKNDSQIILEYKKRMGLKNVFAVCFSSGDETVHHWKTFSHGPSGCCIEFNYDKLRAVIEQIPNLRHGKVTYRKLPDIEKNPVPVEAMPFTKRWPYRCEEEYRILLETNEQMDFFELDIPLDIIRKVTISQHMPKQIYETIKGYLKEVYGNPNSRISRSTLYENQRWINGFKEK